MCAMCRTYPCNSSCPNAPDPAVKGRCKICKEDIVVGDEMVEIEGVKFHYDCLTVDDVLKVLGVKAEVVGDDWYD